MEWGQNSVLLSALLNPLVMADWLLDVDFELTTSEKKQSVQSSVSLMPGESTVFFDTDHAVKDGRGLIGRAQLLEVTDQAIRVAFDVKERLACGHWRTIMSPTLEAQLGQESRFEIAGDQDQATLRLSVMSV